MTFVIAWNDHKNLLIEYNSWNILPYRKFCKVPLYFQLAKHNWPNLTKAPPDNTKLLNFVLKLLKVTKLMYENDMCFGVSLPRLLCPKMFFKPICVRWMGAHTTLHICQSSLVLIFCNSVYSEDKNLFSLPLSHANSSLCFNSELPLGRFYI